MTGSRRRGVFDMTAFAAAVHERVRSRWISYRQAGREAGVDGANLAGRLGGRSLDAETFLRLLVWLGESDVSRYINRPSPEVETDKVDLEAIGGVRPDEFA